MNAIQQQQQRISDAGRLSLAANKSWTSTNRELLAYVEDSSTFWAAMRAYLQLEAHAEIESAEPSIEVYTAIINRSFLTLLDDGTIHLVEPISTLAQTALNAMRTAAGIGAASVAPPVVTKTAEELYEENVIHLWETLPSEKFRARLNADKKMRDTFKKLSETDRIASGVAKKSSVPAERELAADQRLVKVDQTRFVRHIDGAQVSVTEDRALALALTSAEAQQLATRLKRAHFPQAAVVTN